MTFSYLFCEHLPPLAARDSHVKMRDGSDGQAMPPSEEEGSKRSEGTRMGFFSQTNLRPRP